MKNSTLAVLFAWFITIWIVFLVDFDSTYNQTNSIDKPETTIEDAAEIDNLVYEDLSMKLEEIFIAIPEYNNNFTFFEDVVLNGVPVEQISNGEGFKVKKEFVVLESDGYITFKKAE